MSTSEPHSPDPNTAGQSIETIYTTVESHPDRTDWLTVVSNLRQINRQLVEEIARLEQTLATTTQSLHTHKEQNQTHEITILQQQDELKVAHDRIGALFLQLENAHQIGQRQQTLIETLSQQLEIAHAAIPMLEAEKAEVDRKYQLQSQQLIKTEKVAVELHRRLKLQTTAAVTTASPTHERDASEPSTHNTVPEPVSLVRAASALPNPPTSEPETAPTDDTPNSTAAIDPAPPQISIQLPQIDNARRHPKQPTLLEKMTISAAEQSSRMGWREDIANSNRYYSTLESIDNRDCPVPETVDRESTALDEPTAAGNWPTPKIDRPVPSETTAKPLKIDLPKFPKRGEN